MEVLQIEHYINYINFVPSRQVLVLVGGGTF